MSILPAYSRVNISPYSRTDKCIVLDLDETLVYTQENEEQLRQLGLLTDPRYLPLRRRIYHTSIDDVGERKGSGSKYTMWGITRPHLQEFLIFCCSYFRVVAVWSAGKEQYVEAIVSFIFKGIKDPHIVLSYEHCRQERGGLVKPLSQLIESEPLLKRYMSLSNTYALDDREHTFSSNPSNGILIPPYSPPATVSGLFSDDVALLQLRAWLIQPHVANARDVRQLDKSTIFTTPLPQYPGEQG